MTKKPIALALAALAMMNAGAAVTAAPHSLHYLTAEDVAPAGVLPAPPAPGSAQEKAELAEIRAMVASATPERLEQARWDQEHEDPGLFDGILGLELQKLPLTWALLRDVQEEADAAVGQSKVYFHRTRPWGVDPALPSCEHAPEHKPTNSYPSGHAILGYSTGYVLARLLPGRAADVLGRAADYATSREICGVHFPTDVDASHALGTLVTIKLMANPAFRARFDAARKELADAHIAGA
jgi:acid phosphatase (class A)